MQMMVVVMITIIIEHECEKGVQSEERINRRGRRKGKGTEREGKDQNMLQVYVQKQHNETHQTL
jgi:hypothetical protein